MFKIFPKGDTEKPIIDISAMGNAIEAFILRRGEAGIRQISRFMDNIHLGGSGSGTGIIPIEWNSDDESEDADSNWTDTDSNWTEW